MPTTPRFTPSMRAKRTLSSAIHTTVWINSGFDRVLLGALFQVCTLDTVPYRSLIHLDVLKAELACLLTMTLSSELVRCSLPSDLLIAPPSRFIHQQLVLRANIASSLQWNACIASSISPASAQSAHSLATHITIKTAALFLLHLPHPRPFQRALPRPLPLRSGLCALRRLRTARPAPRLFRYLGCKPPSGSLCHLRAQHARCHIHCPDHHLLLSLPRAIHVVCKQSLSCSPPSLYSLRERASRTLYCSNHH